MQLVVPMEHVALYVVMEQHVMEHVVVLQKGRQFVVHTELSVLLMDQRLAV